MPRKLVLAIVLAGMAMLMFASAVMAQSQGLGQTLGVTSDGELQSFEVPTAMTGNSCPDPFTSTFDPDDPATAETFTCLSPEDLAAAEQPDEAATGVADDEATVSCEDFIALGTGEPSQFQAQQFFDFVATLEEQAILDPDGNGFACDGGTIEFGVDPAEDPVEQAAPEQAAPEAPSTAEVPSSTGVTSLPDTGGPALLIAVGAALLGAGWLLRYRG